MNSRTALLRVERIELEIGALAVLQVLDTYLDTRRPSDITPDSRASAASLLMRASQGYAFLSRDSEMEAMLQLLKLDSVLAGVAFTETFTRLYAATSLQQIWSNPESLTLLNVLRGRLQALTALRDMLESLFAGPRSARVLETNDTIGFRVYSEDSAESAEVVSEILVAIEDLYQGCASLLSEESAALRIVYVESGSPVDVVFQTSKAVAGIMQGFYRAYQAFRSLDLAMIDREAESLGLHVDTLTKIHEAFEAGHLKKADAEAAIARVEKRIAALTARGVGVITATEDSEAEQRRLSLAAAKEPARLGHAKS